MCMYVYVYVRTYSHLCTVVEPHTMYETCQSGVNCNGDDVMFYTHTYNIHTLYIRNLKVDVEREIRTYVHMLRLKKGNTNQ